MTTNNINGPNIPNTTPGVSGAARPSQAGTVARFNPAQPGRDVGPDARQSVISVSQQIPQGVELDGPPLPTAGASMAAVVTLPKGAISADDATLSGAEISDGASAELSEDSEVLTASAGEHPPVSGTLPQGAVIGYSEAVMMGAGKVIAGEMDS